MHPPREVVVGRGRPDDAGHVKYLTTLAVIALSSAFAAAVSCHAAPDGAHAVSTVRALSTVHATPPARLAPVIVQTAARSALEPVSASALCVTSGKVTSTGARRLHVDEGGMRAVVGRDRSRSAELEFTYRGVSTTTARLADGELRRQIGLKLRARDTCNIVYVMWHVEPAPGIFVLVKHNVHQSTHGECGDRGYLVLKPDVVVAAPIVERGATHVLRADVDGTELRVSVNGIRVWGGHLPPEAFSFDGPVGMRADNVAFDFQLRVPGGSTAGGACPAAD